jgi:hypothetical protein
VTVRPVHELAEIVEDEVGVLQPVDLVGPVHRHHGIEGHAFHAVALDCMLHLGGRRQDAGTVGLQALLRVDQAEFDGEPVEAGQQMDVGAGLDAAAAIFLHVIGEHRIGEQRHVAEEIVEQVGFDQVVDLLALADPHGHREAAMGEMIVEGGVGNETRHADDAPAGQRLEPRIDRREVGDRIAQLDRLETRQEFRAGIALGQRALTFQQQTPHGLFLGGIEVGMLRNRPVRCHAGIVAAQVLKGSGVHALNMGARGW